ncbi:MAG: FHA domain-containing protein [Spirochaetaceae bacterium]|jgi:pSer/pThr/pTyr-binding forkhead associated (FHA) protein/S1-C subfamily serine protease|nr:FHA domain-containing protein [Spirochaetaceae bacterium]
MRVLKIGRSSSNNIVVNDPTVSSQHASLTISDAGELRIKDLNSRNGTFVNGRRIFQETLITSKDVIKAGNSVIDWQRHLNAPKAVRQVPVIDAAAITRRKTIGRTSANDIVVAYSDVSGSHAQLFEKSNGDIAIADSGSTNGTYVNGHKISTHILRPGDTIMLANKYPLDWSNAFPKVNQEQYLPQNNVPAKTNKTKTLLIASVFIVVVVAAAGFLFVQKPWEAQGPALFVSVSALSPEEIYARYKKSVVLIMGAYYYETARGYYSVDDNGRIVRINSEDDAIFYTGTGFIVSNDGKIITNKHVAAPWEYDDDVIAAIKKATGETNVEGRLAFIGCFLNDTYVSGIQDLIRCTPLKTGATKDIDVAVLQINSKTLPGGAETIIDLNQAVITDDGLVVGASLFTIGFPAGFDLGMTAQGIQANNQDGKITQIRGDVEFGHNIAVEHGASGSPVFNEYGKLVGIINAGYEKKQGYNMAVKAKYAVELVK